MPINPVHFAHGVCDEFLRYLFSAFRATDFLEDRHLEFQRKHDPIYAELLDGMADEALAKTFVSYWTIGQNIATQSRFRLDATIAEITVFQVKHKQRQATHAYSEAREVAMLPHANGFPKCYCPDHPLVSDEVRAPTRNKGWIIAPYDG